MKRTDHAARNETHKSSPPRVDPARGERHEREKEGTVGEDIARHEVSLLFVIKIPRLKGSRGRRERGKRERERERKRPSLLAGIGQKGVARLEKHEISIKETSLVMRRSGFIGSRFTPWRQNVCVCSCSLRAHRPARAC